MTVAETSARADHEHEHDGHLSIMNQCAKTCNETAHHCMEKIRQKEGNVADHAKVHDFAMDCQAFCNLSATLMARSSELAAVAHAANAEACAKCAEACANSSDQSEQVKACEKSCRECEKVCRAMSKGHEHHHEA